MNRDKLPASACPEGAAYYNSFKTGQAFWKACDNPAWMLWAHARSTCPVPWAYVALAAIWTQDAAAGCAAYAADWAAADAAACAARAAADAAADAADAADAARPATAAGAPAGTRQGDDLGAALPWFPGFKP